ncbi:MAG: hypothetical protein HC907_22465 [Richelia sp. SM1_7_0]|nr:hypothetical protein [Richelia sp. SM1_7_0]
MTINKVRKKTGENFVITMYDFLSLNLFELNAKKIIIILNSSTIALNGAVIRRDAVGLVTSIATNPKPKRAVENKNILILRSSE